MIAKEKHMNPNYSNRGLTILIATYNASAMIEETLRRLQAMDKVPGLPWEVLLVDNNSTDDTVQKARISWNNGAKLRIINEPKQGAGFASFRGMKEANYSYIGFVDQDNWVRSDWMTKSVSYLEASAEIAIVCAKGYPVFETEEPAWFKRYQQNFAVGPQSKTNGNAENINTFFYNASSIMRKNAIDDLLLKGFAPLMKSRATNLILAGDDTEIQMMLRLLGWEIHYQDDICFDHYMPAKRLSLEYFREMRKGMGATSVYLGIYRNALNAHFGRVRRTKINWEVALEESKRRTLSDPLAIGASLFPKFATNHRVATFWSNFGEFQERKRLKVEFDTVQTEIYAWLDSWIA